MSAPLRFVRNHPHWHRVAGKIGLANFLARFRYRYYHSVDLVVEGWESDDFRPDSLPDFRYYFPRDYWAVAAFYPYPFSPF